MDTLNRNVLDHGRQIRQVIQVRQQLLVYDKGVNYSPYT